MDKHHWSNKCGGGGMAMEEEDRLSSLPDELLHAILRALPLKQAVRTTALSRRWAPQWLRALAASRVLDLTDQDLLARGQPPALAAATVSRCLRLHAEHGGPLDVFRVALAAPPPPPPSGPGPGPSDVTGWIAAAVSRGAREVEVDLHLTPSRWQEYDDPPCLELPGDLFQATNSLERLALGGLRLPAAAAAVGGLAGLRSLCLSRVGVTDEAVRGILAGCRALESLSLRRCPILAEEVSIAATASERLRELELLGCWGALEDMYGMVGTSVSIACERLRKLDLLGCRALRELRVDAPALESLTFNGPVCWTSDHYWGEPRPAVFNLDQMPALRDAYLSHLGYAGCGLGVPPDPQHYQAVVHARILTLCFMGLWLLYYHSRDEILFREMPNLEELQLLLASPPDWSSDSDDPKCVSTFFMLTPLPVLQRLFLHLASDLGYRWSRDDSDDEAQLPSDLGYGWSRDWDSDDDDYYAYLRIEHEIVLDHLTLIKVFNFKGTRPELRLLTFFLKRAPSLEQLVLVTAEGEEAPADKQLKAMQERVSELHKSSREARISVCRPKDDDSPNHAHTRFFHEDEYVTNKTQREVQSMKKAQQFLVECGAAEDSIEYSMAVQLFVKKPECREFFCSVPTNNEIRLSWLKGTLSFSTPV